MRARPCPGQFLDVGLMLNVLVNCDGHVGSVISPRSKIRPKNGFSVMSHS